MEFVGDYSKALLCIECKKPWDPSTSKQCDQCESTYCKPCLDTVGNMCNACKKKVTFKPLPKLVRQLAESVKVYCPHKSHGCDWTGPRSDADAHAASCSKAPKPTVVAPTKITYAYVDEGSLPDELQCPICHTPFVDPVQLPCEHVFCSGCITAALNKEQQCPCDRQPAHPTQLSPAPKMIQDYVNDLPVFCPNKGACDWVGPRAQVADHAKQCTKKPAASQDDDQKISLTPLTEFSGFDPAAPAETPIYALAHMDAPRLVALEQRKKPLSISAVIDVSGSMAGGKLKMAQDSLKFMIDELSDRDELGIIAFHTDVSETIALTKMDDEGKRRCKAAADSLRALSRTNLSGGLFTGINQVQHKKESAEISPPSSDEEPPHEMLALNLGLPQPPERQVHREMHVSKGISRNSSAKVGFRKPTRKPVGQVSPKPPHSGLPTILPLPAHVPDTCRVVLLFTDGIANNGITDEAQFKETLQGVLKNDLTLDMSIHTFGFGADHNARLLQGLAEIAGGSYYFIQDVATMKESFADCLGGLLSTVAQNISLTVKAAAGFEVEKVLTDFKQETKNGSTVVKMKDVYSSEKRDVLLKMKRASTGSTTSTATMKPMDLVHLAIHYDSLLSAKPETVEKMCTIVCGRADAKEVPNKQVLEQRARIEATAAMLFARERADAGDALGARQIMKNKRTELQAMCPESSYTNAMCDDMEEVEQAMDSDFSWQNAGSKQMAAVTNCHAQQRMNRASESKAQSLGYDNEWKHAMRSKSRKS